MRAQAVGSSKVTVEKEACSRDDVVSDFGTWSQAFAVFQAYRSFYYPELVMPLIAYHDVIASLHVSGVPSQHWLDNDRQFRRHAASRPDDFGM